ncbi:hypothetical protein ATCC90586_002820 [Pythium insidiosum]|nr:hypothetical protein ATCC90586_002820 [Pythium insidiosum]
MFILVALLRHGKQLTGPIQDAVHIVIVASVRPVQRLSLTSARNVATVASQPRGQQQQRVRGLVAIPQIAVDDPLLIISQGRQTCIALKKPNLMQVTATLQRLLWAPSQPESDIQRWHQQGFVFQPSPFPLGLLQGHGGPYALMAQLPVFQSHYGVVRFMFSVLLTKGVDVVRDEMDDRDGTLTGQFGHCSQELLNLLLTGVASSNVFDGTVPMGDTGLVLRGVTERPAVGYLTQLEALRYCQVGHYFKSPSFPVWVIGSASHFSVCVGLDIDQLCGESASQLLLQRIQHTFKTFDPMETGFIELSSLRDSLTQLGVSHDIISNEYNMAQVASKLENPVLDLPKLVFQTTTLLTYLYDGFPVVIISVYTSIPLILAFALSSAWMLTLAAIQVAPTAFANRIMDTAELDNGEFWLLPDADENVMKWVLAADIPKLAFQTMTLLDQLSDGVSSVVVLAIAALLLINWLLSASRCLAPTPDPQFIRPRIFYCFDLTFAVFVPLYLLLYADSMFTFDRAAFSARIDSLEEGSFDRMARLFGDPAEISMFRFAMSSLLFHRLDRLFIRMILNVLSLYRGQSLIRSLVNLRYKSSTHLLHRGGILVFVYIALAVTSTTAACQRFPQCAVPRYQWNFNSQQCSCLVFIDRQVVKTFSEWEEPPESKALGELAGAGYLRIVQVINRAVLELPDQLRRCHDLEQLILIYTKIERIPDWASEFQRLEYLHIEGDFTHHQLVDLPADLFAHMPRLMSLHLGSHIQLPLIPELSGVPRLRQATFALLHSITELPSFDDLHRLERLFLIDLIRVYDLPSLSHLKSLTTFSLLRRNPMCCNGFIRGTCNLAHFQCQNRTGEPVVTCTSARLSDASWATLSHTTGVVCQENWKADLKALAPTVLSTDQACGGVLYKRCTLNGKEGICMNARMQVVSCETTGRYEKLRRLEIARGVGLPCDPAVEQWLGCGQV